MATTALKEPLRKYKFRVEVIHPSIGMARGGYNKVGGLGNSRGSSDYAEGGDDFVDQLPGREKGKDITLSRGAMQDDNDFWNLYESLRNSNDRFQLIIVF